MRVCSIKLWIVRGSYGDWMIWMVRALVLSRCEQFEATLVLGNPWVLRYRTIQGAQGSFGRSNSGGFQLWQHATWYPLEQMRPSESDLGAMLA